MQPTTITPQPPPRSLPFWGWLLIIFAGCVVLSVFGFGVFAAWLGATDNPVMRKVYAQTNPDFEILEYVPRKAQLSVRHRATNRKFFVYIASLRDNRIDYRTLATKQIPTPDWAARPVPNQPAATAAKDMDVLDRMMSELADHDFHLTNSSDGIRELCNFNSVECAIVAIYRPAGGHTGLTVTFYGPPDN